MKYGKVLSYIKEIYKTEDFIPLHIPTFFGNEKQYVLDSIDSRIVSTIGNYVVKFEKKFSDVVGVNYCIATSSGTSALHMALKILKIPSNTEVLTQALTYVATCNAISYVQAIPHFIDVDIDTFGMSPNCLEKHLENIAVLKDGMCYNRHTNRQISACIPVHTLGHPCRIDEIIKICNRYNIPVIEDAAEALGITYKGKQVGTFGDIGVFSFNGNKIITAGGGGAIVMSNEKLSNHALHLSTTAKLPHSYEYNHDLVGYNLRLPNLNAALLLGQLENLDEIVNKKRALAKQYSIFFSSQGINFKLEPIDSKSNYWLNALVFQNKLDRTLFLESSNQNGIMTRAIFSLMTNMPMYQYCPSSNIENSLWLESRVVKIPSYIL